MDEISLCQLKPDECGRITELGQYAAVRRRLRDLGFLPGADIICLFAAPSGSPIAFYIKGTVLALRKEDCNRIKVKRCE